MILLLPKIAFRTLGKKNSIERPGVYLKITGPAPSSPIFSRKPSKGPINIEMGFSQKKPKYFSSIEKRIAFSTLKDCVF